MKKRLIAFVMSSCIVFCGVFAFSTVACNAAGRTGNYYAIFSKYLNMTETTSVNVGAYMENGKIKRIRFVNIGKHKARILKKTIKDNGDKVYIDAIVDKYELTNGAVRPVRVKKTLKASKFCNK